MRKIYLLFLLFLTILNFGHSEELQNPFVSKLKSVAEENLIRLSWVDSPDTVHKYLIYRHVEEINNDNFESAQFVGESDTGNGYFIDYPSTIDKFYYAVLSLDSSGKTYNLFIPYKNITTIPVGVDSIASPEELAVTISDIKTVLSGNTIEISFQISGTNRNLVIYRSADPIRIYEDLIKAALITTIPSSQYHYIDHPVPGVPYYYAIMDSDLAKSGRYVFNSGENITEHSILVKSGVSASLLESRETIRNQPLPYLELNSRIDTGEILSPGVSELPVKYNLTFESTSVINSILNNFYPEEKTMLIPVILADDIDISESSEEYQLKRILESDFKDQNWPIAYELISNLLSVHHSEQIELKAHFYRGQILFFQNKYRDSFMEFILAGKDFTKETEPWLDELLTILHNSEQ